MPRFGAGNRSVSKLVITICVAAILVHDSFLRSIRIICSWFGFGICNSHFSIDFAWFVRDQFLPSLSYGAPRGKSSVFSLFNLKEKSRFWSESVFRSGTLCSVLSAWFWIFMWHYPFHNTCLMFIRVWWSGVFSPLELRCGELHKGRNHCELPRAYGSWCCLPPCARQFHFHWVWWKRKPR